MCWAGCFERRLALFADGWSLEAAEALGSDLVRPQADVLELLSRLVGKSMVLVEGSGQDEPGVLRYRFLETIRQYLERNLVEAGSSGSRQGPPGSRQSRA